jgi:hypothetical protein
MYRFANLLHFLQHDIHFDREDTIDDSEMMRRQMNPTANNMAFDAEASFKQEKAALTSVRKNTILNLLGGYIYI